MSALLSLMMRQYHFGQAFDGVDWQSVSDVLMRIAGAWSSSNREDADALEAIEVSLCSLAALTGERSASALVEVSTWRSKVGRAGIRALGFNNSRRAHLQLAAVIAAERDIQRLDAAAHALSRHGAIVVCELLEASLLGTPAQVGISGHYAVMSLAMCSEEPLKHDTGVVILTNPLLHDNARVFIHSLPVVRGSVAPDEYTILGMAHADHLVRVFAMARLCKTVSGEKAEELLLPMLQDEVREVVVECLRELEKVGGERTLASLARVPPRGARLERIVLRTESAIRRRLEGGVNQETEER
ncbi:MAG: hypothetical protein HUU15_13545 [Candidatus Brocadiae bacterium]|nr:hypothetical protein [Candidatus Brocadiia bacterium]